VEKATDRWWQVTKDLSRGKGRDRTKREEEERKTPVTSGTVGNFGKKRERSPRRHCYKQETAR